MKNWLARAVTNTAMRGRDRRSRFTRWSRWFADEPAVDAAAFQDDDEPFPRHWRESPRAWPPGVAEEPAVEASLRDAVRDLPDTWREVVVDRDVRRQPPETVAARHGLTREQERDIVNRARARLRQHILRTVRRGDMS